MYINIGYIKEKDLTLQDILAMQMLKQNKTEDMLEPLISLFDNDYMMPRFEKLGLMERVKEKKKQEHPFTSIRLSKKGNEILYNAEIPYILEEDVIIAEWLRDMYLQDGKEVGNFKKTKLLIAQFRVHSGISKNSLATLCTNFMGDEKEWQYTQRLEYLFWKKDHMYNVKFNIDQSRLYQYYLKHRDYFEKEFEKAEKKSKK